MFNIINEEGLEFDGVKVDVNPINVRTQKDIDRYKQKSAQYDAEVSGKIEGDKQTLGKQKNKVAGAPTHETETLDNGDVRITNRNSRGEITNVSVERDGKIVSVDTYQDGALFEHTEYDADGRATKVTRYDKNGEVVGVQEYEGGVAKAGKRSDNVATKGTKGEVQE